MTFSTEEEQLVKFKQDEVAQHYFEVLRTLVSKKSIFAQQIGLQDVAAYLGEIFANVGAEVTIDETYKAPFVIAKFKSPNPDAKTIIFYNHYDTVPADNDQLWTDDPFKLTVRKGYMYGRGVDDDKGHITARLTAVRKYIREIGELPVNITFIIEGAEESASTDLEKYLEKYAERLLPAELLIWEQGVKNNLGQLEITGGNKGIITFDLSVSSAEVDIHSKYGAVVESATWYLLNAISSMRADDGQILIDGIYDKILAPNERELDLVERFALENSDGLRRVYGLKLPVLKKERRQFLKTYFFEPALSIEGISSGYQGQGVKTILPASASAKMEMRLVPGLSPRYVFDKINTHLRRHGFEHVKVTFTLGEESYRSDMSAPAILNVIDLAKTFYKAGVSVLPTAAGTGPMYTVYQALGVPMLAFGLGNPHSRDHGGDENVSLADYYRHIELIKELIRSYE
ncbi:M20/M25/M40 family metallo-hydrolase [Streptococcus macacae]|uniref:Peptidase dimerization domain protein n=1 Tax=Streptococcus macacae NCTC 11558 TaxID=764298 RepID=G5JUZ9_9STRE|nr:M20/M25/M40 family metallo-hydrolase [Streptococcus macacae]EHJ52140.1 peptidase dimerization domain protein [Streptococcus macacae NCTC 11558]SUN79296.1 peptidase, AtmC, ArgE/DapE/Acy1 family protein [Streptococcus macacae NCTC 11558]